MDKIQKFLQKLSDKNRKIVEDLIAKILNREFHGLDIKRLKGLNGLFRVRKGSIRIIFLQEEEVFRIISIDHRSESTYKDL